MHLKEEDNLNPVFFLFTACERRNLLENCWQACVIPSLRASRLVVPETPIIHFNLSTALN